MSPRITSKTKEWSFSRKAVTVFAICYAFLYMFPRPFSEVPGLDFVFSVYTKPLELATIWFGKTILGISTLEKIAVTGCLFVVACIDCGDITGQQEKGFPVMVPFYVGVCALLRRAIFDPVRCC